MLNRTRYYYLERYTPTILLISAFGPLLIPSMGIRLDQFLLYAYLPVAVGLFCVGRRSLLSKSVPLAILFIFIFITAWTLIVTVGGVPDHVGASYRTTMDELAAFENYAHTIALITVLGVAIDLSNGPKSSSLLDKLGSILIVLMCLNAVIAMSAIFTGSFPLAKYFVPGFQDVGDTPFELVSEIGRFTGIFDTPSAAGAAYSVTLLLWCYLSRKSDKHLIRNYLAGGILIVGGTITISKIFLFGGIPLFFVYWMLPGRISSRMTLKLLSVIVAAIIAIIIFSELWIGLPNISGFFVSDDNYDPVGRFFHFIKIRYGTADGILFGGIFSYVWDVSPVVGLGFSYLAIADSAYLLYFMEGGIISLLLYVIFVLFIIYLGVQEWRNGYEIGRFLAFLGGFLLIAGIGAPIITMPRTGMIFWTVLLLALAVRTELHSLRAQAVQKRRITIPNKFQESP